MRFKKRLVLIELNEINFDLVKIYIEKYKSRFPGFQKLLQTCEVVTNSETQYENLEPWIQWASVHTGLSFAEHNIFRLGDIVASSKKQIFEVLEESGFSIGAISPMNAVNRLSKPAYFISDPWTNTRSDDSWLSKVLAKAISQSVNDNAVSKISLRSALYLTIGLILFSKKKRFFKYLKLAIGSIGHPWRKALFLDLFLHDLHLNWFKNKLPNFSVLFLNAGAHIQHHYLFNSLMNVEKKYQNPDWYVNSKLDPFIEMLDIYDCIISDYLNVSRFEFIFATGLSQKMYDRIKYYYRLQDHAQFLNFLGITYKNVYPRMTRDFLIDFENQDDTANALVILEKIKVNNEDKLFGHIDVRKNELFVTLTYSKEINQFSQINIGLLPVYLFSHVSFVAIKNGMHQAKGYIYASKAITPLLKHKEINIKDLYKTIENYFIGTS
jgi:hypothetical protein